MATETRHQYQDEDILTVEDVAEYLRIGYSSVVKLMNLAPSNPRRLPTLPLGIRKRRIAYWQLRQWIERTSSGATL